MHGNIDVTGARRQPPGRLITHVLHHALSLLGTLANAFAARPGKGIVAGDGLDDLILSDIGICDTRPHRGDVSFGRSRLPEARR